MGEGNMMTMLPKEGKNFWEKIFGAAEVGRLGFSRQTFIGGEMENLLMEEEKREAWEGNSKCCFQIQEWDRKSTQDLILT